MYIRALTTNPYITMKLLVATAFLYGALGVFSMNASIDHNDKKKGKKEKKSEVKESTSRNFHSIKKWKMTIEYINGDIISKTIEVGEGATRSAMETAFLEAEKYIKTLKKVKGYEVSPVTNNQFVLLATN